MTLSAAAGERIGIVGPNGAGKSTFLSLLAGLERPSEGRVLLDGVPLSSLGARARARRLAFLPQEPACAFPFEVRNIVAMGRHPHGRGDAPADRDAVAAALRDCDLEFLAARPVTSLSGGERKRVFLAQCLAQTPAVLLLDEPTAHLDFLHASAFESALRSAAERGMAVIFATHDLPFAARACDRALLLSSGLPFAQGPAAAILDPATLAKAYGRIPGAAPSVPGAGA